ncbi:hypothetical protein SISSUDRAFT_1061757 [Sistotremastrum suecicum HHB10207 ss-3]|uniref:Transmembrane protein n=1 Tax=Sistotremastrum suecicum HHB10207 ss-3 TaxID=1314776 RepID=A0A166DND8_9AGAM|nr:hypothetical protein SISSUDRAFT_1061757 [Sistotremastrum suecicum HHB10207 ss-3]
MRSPLTSAKSPLNASSQSKIQSPKTSSIYAIPTRTNSSSDIPSSTLRSRKKSATQSLYSRAPTSLKLSASDLTPDISAREALKQIQEGLQDLRDKFEDWKSTKPKRRKVSDPKAEKLFLIIDILHNDAEAARETTAKVIASHTAFAQIFENVLSNASESSKPRLFRDPDEERIELMKQVADDIHRYTAVLEDRIEHIRTGASNLEQHVRDMEKSSSKRNPWPSRIAAFVKYALSICSIVLAIATPILALFPGCGLVLSAAAGASSAAAAAASVAAGCIEKRLKKLTPVEELIQKRIPQEMLQIHRNLQAFPAYQNILLAEITVQSGQAVRMASREELADSQEQWSSHLAELQTLDNDSTG